MLTVDADQTWAKVLSFPPVLPSIVSRVPAFIGAMISDSLQFDLKKLTKSFEITIT
jgi:hypothetical protein